MRVLLSAFAASLDRMPWRVYEVRRVIRPQAGDPARPANASRSLRAVAAGSRTQMTAVLRTMAKAEDASVENEDGIERAWLRRRSAAFPAAEHFLVAASAGPEDKDGSGLEAACQFGGSGRRPPEPATRQLMLPPPGQRQPESMRPARTAACPYRAQPPGRDAARCLRRASES